MNRCQSVTLRMYSSYFLKNAIFIITLFIG